MTITEEMELARTDPTLFAFACFVIGKTTAPVDNLRNTIALKAAGVMGCKPQVQRLIIDARAEHRAWVTTTQRRWQTRGSRRPQRGRNHDSWAIREQYVRCTGNWTDYYEQGETLKKQRTP